MASSRWGAEDVALFLVLTILANGLLFGASSHRELIETFYLALYVHLGFSLYLGAFHCRRTWTWLALIGGWAAAEIAGFAAFVVPVGAAIFRLANSPPIGPPLAKLVAAAPAAWPGAALVLLGLDLCAMHAARWRSRSLAQIAAFLAAVLVAAVAVGLLAAALAPSRPATPPSFAILPDWPLLPFFALLRAARSSSPELPSRLQPCSRRRSGLGLARRNCVRAARRGSGAGCQRRWPPPG